MIDALAKEKVTAGYGSALAFPLLLSLWAFSHRFLCPRVHSDVISIDKASGRITKLGRSFSRASDYSVRGPSVRPVPNRTERKQLGGWWSLS
jgi:hypothetical protein